MILKDGTGVTLRPLKEVEVELLDGMFSRLSEEDKWFLDHGATDFENVNGIAECRDRNRAAPIVGVLEGQVIAIATLSQRCHGARMHNGQIEISVDPSFRGLHLATLMLLELINLAMDLNLEILTMHLVDERDASLRHSVEKLGFKKKAVLPGFVKDQSGRPYDLMIMFKKLHKGPDQSSTWSATTPPFGTSINFSHPFDGRKWTKTLS